MKTFCKKLEQLLELGGVRKDITFLVLSGIALLCSIFQVIPLPFDAAWAAILLCGIPIVLEAFIGLVTEFDIKADVLVSLALIASVAIGEHFAAGEVAFIMQLGGLLEELTVARARAGIEKLVRLTPQTARVIRGQQEEIIPAEEVTVGEILRVLPGETVPVDGEILSGQTSINQAVMTGESLPVDKTVGDEVSSGTVNQFGAFEMKATKVGEDSSIQRMIRLVQTADAGKAKIVGMADRWATWIVVIALAAAGITWFVTGEVIRAVTILVVFCPCALVLATPTAIMAAIGNATKHGFLVREGDALERFADVSEICFDKTGTLTLGTPKVVAVKSIDPQISEAELYRMAAVSEKNSEHPLGKALIGCYMQETKEEVTSPKDFQMLPGRGVCAVVDGKTVLAGNQKLLQEKGIASEAVAAAGEAFFAAGCSVIYLAIEDRAAGVIAMSDVLRENMSGVMQQIKAGGISPVLLTGDNACAAGEIAGQLQIEKVVSDCLPEDKLHYVEQSGQTGDKICMIGDGVNDAPALKRAYVGIAMGGVGSDIAVDAADIVLVEDKIEELPHLIGLSKRMMRTIRMNLTFSMTLNFVAIACAITGILNPVVGALVHNAGSVLVIVNSAFLLRWRRR